MKLVNNIIQHSPANKNKRKTKQQYKSPHLIEYGHIAKLTQGSGGTKGDGGTFTRA